MLPSRRTMVEIPRKPSCTRLSTRLSASGNARRYGCREDMRRTAHILLPPAITMSASRWNSLRR
ncbi:hypothetical protein KCP69_07600 [Salmonella enterica subsp. enterica]|nr:hypothetical protein KCP69_07600 [Salmonella enterica subsp. enterica]